MGKKRVNMDARVIAFLNQKGGVGKTTLAFNVAHSLGQQGYKVLCLDMDPQSNLSFLCKSVDQQQNGHIFHLLINSLKELKSLHTPYTAGDLLVSGERCDCLPAGSELAGLELTVAALNFPRQLVLKNFLEKSGLLHWYDYIIIDGPPTLGLLVINILCASQGLYVPFTPDSFSKQGIKLFHETLENVADMGIVSPVKILGFIPNLVDPRRRQSWQDYLEIKNILEKMPQPAPVFAPFMNKSPLTKCLSARKSVYDYSAKEFVELQEQFRLLAAAIVQEDKVR